MSIKLREKALSKGDKSYYLDIYQAGKRTYEFLDIRIGKKDSKESKRDKLELANRIRAKRELEIISEDYDFIPKHRKRTDFLEFYRSFLANYQGKDHRLVRYSLEKFEAFLGKEKLISSKLTTKLCEGFAAFLKNPDKSGLRGETPYNYWTKFKRVVRVAKNEGLIKKNPTFDIKVKRVSTLKKEVLTSEELSKLARSHCGNDHVKRAFLFCCFTGLGAAEIRKLTWSRIQNDKIKIFREKNGEPIWNDLNQTAIKLLGNRGEEKELIFHFPSDPTIKKHLTNWMRKAGITKNISFYCGRHTFAVQLLNAKTNLKTVADCLGHSSTRETLKYLTYTDELKSEAISNLTELDI